MTSDLDILLRNTLFFSLKTMRKKYIKLLVTGYWILDAGYWILDAGCWILDAGYWMLDAGCWMLNKKNE